MSTAAVHRIRRQRWIVHTRTASDAFAIRASVRASWEDEFLPAIERAFDRAHPGDEVVHIPRLEIRLTVPARTDLRERLGKLLEETVAHELSLALAPAVRDTRPATERRTEGEERFSTLLHYVRTGTLPWTAILSRAAEAIVLELRATARSELPRLASLAGGGADARDEVFRILQLLSEDAVASLPQLAPALPTRWRAALARLLAAGGDGSVVPADGLPAALHARLTAAAALIVEARGHAPTDDANAIAAVARGGMSAAAFATVVPMLRDSGVQGVPDPQAIALAMPNAPVGPTHEDTTAPLTSSAAMRGARATIPHFASAAAEARTAPPFFDSRDDEHPIAVGNAGLILLHPYIVRLFTVTGVVVDGTLRDTSRSRAAALLHRLATGRDEIHELELGLVKLLVGVAPDESFPIADGLLLANDADECTALLEAVVEHWSILKRTSIGALRASFLQRAALLRRVEHGWSLHPETAPYDVLLDSLPWSFSVVRLPWMPEPVHTEWTTR